MTAFGGKLASETSHFSRCASLPKRVRRNVTPFSPTGPAVHVVPAEKLGAAWHDLQSEALASVHTVVPLAVAAARHMTGGLGCGDGAGGGCERHRR